MLVKCRGTGPYLECAKEGVRETEVPSGVQKQKGGSGEQSSRSRKQSPREAEAYFLMNAEILIFWKNKISELLKKPSSQNWNRLKGGGRGIAPCTPR